MGAESEVLRRHARSFSILVAIVLLTTGCAKAEVGIPATNTEAPSPPTSTASPTHMPTRTPTQAPTSMPFDDNGPWLLGYGGGGLTLYDLSGNKRSLWNSPPLWDPENDVRLETGVSSKGWLAVRTASNSDPPADIAISIIRPPLDQPVRNIPLLSSDLAARFQGNGTGEDGRWRDDDLYQMVLNRLCRIRWSPEGRYMAFAAALDGPSTDLYVYDILTDAVRRLSNEPEHVVVFGWSPDSQWIIYAEADAGEDLPPGYAMVYPVGYEGVALRAAAVESGETRELIAFTNPLRFKLLAWASPTIFFLALFDVTGYPVGLQSVDLESRQVQVLYDGPSVRSDADGESGTVAFTVWAEDQTAGGIYVIDATQGEQLMISESFAQIPLSEFIVWSPQLGRYLTESHAGVLVFESSGEVTQRFDQETCLPEPSPDGVWLAFSICNQWSGINRPGLRLYSTEGDFVQTVSEDDIQDIAWRPDSTGLFYIDGSSQMIYFDLALGESRIIDENVQSSLILIQPSSLESE